MLWLVGINRPLWGASIKELLSLTGILTSIIQEFSVIGMVLPQCSPPLHNVHTLLQDTPRKVLWHKTSPLQTSPRHYKILEMIRSQNTSKHKNLFSLGFQTKFSTRKLAFKLLLHPVLQHEYTLTKTISQSLEKAWYGYALYPPSPLEIASVLLFFSGRARFASCC